MRGAIGSWMALTAVALGITARAQPLPVLIIGDRPDQGIWRYTSFAHAQTLDATGRFEAQVVDADHAVDAMDARDYPLVIVDASAAVLEESQIVALNPSRVSPASSLRQRLIVVLERGGGVILLSRCVSTRPLAGFEALGFAQERAPAGHGKMTIHGPAREHAIWDGIAEFEIQDQLIPLRIHPTAHAFAAARVPGGESIAVGVAARIGDGRAAMISLGNVTADDPSSKRSVLSPGFRTLLSRTAEWAATGAVTLPAEWADTLPHNHLSDAARAEDWKLLFDGQSMSHFRGFKSNQMPSAGWSVQDGTIHHPAKAGGGDIITRETFSDFELSLQWKAAPAGNSGIIYRCTEDHQWSWETGIEMQLLDDAAHPDAKRPETSAGALYAIAAPAFDVVRPAGEWNSARIVARGTRIEHWLNGIKVVDIDAAGDAYKAARLRSKWKNVPTMGSVARGHIALQDHGDAVWFRDIMIRELNP